MHWKSLTESFINQHNEVGGILIRYEDLINNKINNTTLENYLQINNINKNILEHKIGSRKKSKKLSFLEKTLLGALQKTTSKKHPDFFS